MWEMPAITMAEQLGRVTSVSGSQITAALETDSMVDWLGIGTVVKVSGAKADTICAIVSVQAETLEPQRLVLVADLIGQIAKDGADNRFTRGVSHYPIPGAPLHVADERDLKAIYGRPSEPSIRVGTLYNDATTPAYVLIDDLLAKHFAVLGTTGSGKSSAVTLILSAILAARPNAHVILLDPHNEYTLAFGDLAEVVTVDNLRLPLWLLDFEEAVRALVRGGTTFEQQSQTMILKEAITWARRHYDGNPVISPGSISVDTPVPFRVFELLRFINDEMGRLGRPDTATPYMRLRARIESLREDRRFAFMFSGTEDDSLAQTVGRLLRIPVSGKPLTIVDLSGVPSEITDVVVSLLCRIIFDFSAWSDRERMPPLLLVCEEAHRYVPSDERVGFDATTRAVTRIAKEGRKYGISLALVTQRPSELSANALSQCGTIFAMRLGSDADQQLIEKTLPDAARGMLTALSSLPQREAMVSGESVRLPMRIRFDDLPSDRHLRSEGLSFSDGWRSDPTSTEFLEDGIRGWRLQRRSQNQT
jgi:uncharacterized protein